MTYSTASIAAAWDDLDAALADLPPASLSPVGAGGTHAAEPLRGRLGALVPCLRALAVVAVRRRHARQGTT